MKNQGREFEHLIEASFVGYAAGSIANLMMMPVPTKAVRNKRGILVRVTTGKAPFDVIGYRFADGKMIGAELKSSERKESLMIRGPGKGGDGIQFHQLDALAALADAGGIARLVWYNGGEVGVLSNEAIINVWKTYLGATRSEASGKTSQKRSKSVPWDRFVSVDYANVCGTIAIAWLDF